MGSVYDLTPPDANDRKNRQLRVTSREWRSHVNRKPKVDVGAATATRLR
ncbi:hypothetical protein Jden_0048 [Jonesia denitrificans DSM 20603]|uniref:Uncharacterized protein n=1 Tax=Jonesia denitrificans (strain ATCC 14870 / DSM 20603 / BCRC 15368 / CIP 55.134 / JCM 11481 / NBRC 15587 / NCTC 10816 / Prevot 55134) TaxID=471856 RepID=C7R548_JONDD|nr:hypothetical protein Jden_0048 [Jonesia denitrificans DSM 20603]SQH19695.1 Uncharacterised protein [Jonesia denitrificans]